ncbi:MAG TPA: glycine--tRNA ligase subunit beta [Candidatus Omnitrophota bacterium]|nr:glycine--tRNA ligase subunit beta [Candidatus Omnitrophota bacterium]
MAKSSPHSGNFLLEIGTEELPTDALSLLADQFRPEFEKGLSASRIPFEETEFFYTPRRLVVFVKNIGNRQNCEVAEWLGPSWEKSYDSEGNPTPALQGFLRGRNLSEGDLFKKETPRGLYVCAKKTLEGKKTAEILPELILGILKDFPFPKRMRWDASGFAFPRPVRWILALLGPGILRFSIGDVSSGDFTFGHRFLSKGKLRVKSADLKTFRQLLAGHHVMLCAAERRRTVRRQLDRKAGKIKWDEELISVTADLTEEPFVVAGQFDGDFLDLPKEILSTCMKKNQKIFALKDGAGNAKAGFAAVLNGERKDKAKIVRDYQGVLHARLRDARFFYAEDCREPLEKKIPRLAEIVFLGKLGNLHEKMTRMTALAEVLGGELGLSPEDLGALKRACALCKADLLTQMVYEFPELQGIMGREYARANGEKEAVARAIADHYLPRQLGQPFEELRTEQTESGALLAILDRIDTLVGAFGIGLAPTGSHDPYALRRAAGGIVKILRAFRFRFDLRNLICRSAGFYGGKLTGNEEGVFNALKDFFKDRVAFELGVKGGMTESEIFEAVWRTSGSEIAGVYARYDELKSLLEKDRKAFERARKVVERTHNILKGAGGEVPEIIDTGLFKYELEQKVYDALKSAESAVSSLLKEGRFEEATKRYGNFFHDILHEFFEQILVNDPDPALRSNRQGLMKRINLLYTVSGADLSAVNPVI